MSNRKNRARKAKKSRLGLASAITKTLVEVIDNVIAGAFAALIVDMVVPTIGAVARLEIAFGIVALFAIVIYLRSNE